MRAIVVLLMVIGPTVFAELDFKQMAATQRDQPPSVITTEAVEIATTNGTVEIPKGMEVKLQSVSDDGKLTVQYNGQQYQVLANNTDIENRVIEIRSHRLIVGGNEYEDFRFARQTPTEVTIIHSRGIVTVKLADLPLKYQNQLGYDPEAARKYVEKLEADRQAEAERKRKKEAEANEPLAGQDLDAWKLARQAADERCNELNNPPRPPVPMGAPVAGSASAYAIIANAQNAAMSPIFELQPEPRRGLMQKSSTGDWIFVFPVKASYYDTEKRARVPKMERMDVKVTNYGNEIRVEGIGLESQ